MLASADGYDRASYGPEAAAKWVAELARRLWSALAAKRYDPGPADGVMGGRTCAAIAASHARLRLDARLTVSPPFVRTT